ncbi:hypothetical protein PR202_gb18226 [Eleusine coracana subsp. coracana]|uniref:Uncharacterized protein n=1 Tax=Eleusine coracana subsp. coracana TaxID=191504 RepID=A0AAV5F517_ELECO|nr:hypothetical protein PR202_gb18226 [Eleusine coracana subsp. coracana]
MAILVLLRANPIPIPLPFSTAPQASITWTSSTAARCSSSLNLKLSAVQFQQPLRSDSDPWGGDDAEEEEQQHDEEAEDDLDPEKERKGISGIHVPRQRYIAVPKAALLDAVLPLFSSEDAAAEFKRFARCLDAVLHAEHKQMLEEMRTYYMLAKQHKHQDDDQPPVVDGETSGFFGITQEDGTLFLTRSLGLRTLLGLSPDPDSQTRQNVPIGRSLASSLASSRSRRLGGDTHRHQTTSDAGKPTAATAVDQRRRPAATPNGCRPQVLKRSTGNQGFQIWIDKLKVWLQEQTYADNSLLSIENSSGDKLQADQLPDADAPIWIAAQKAVLRYEGILSPVGPRGRLLRRLLAWTGLIPSLPKATVKPDVETKHLEGYVRPNFLPRITLANIWEPASRESCDNNVWEIVKASFRILFGKSTLQEPAFQELILLYTDESAQREVKDKAEMLPLQLKIYEKIPIPDLPVVFPHKKLSFRILDTVRLDIATVVGSLAYVVNYKFESLASSPSAFLLDIVATTALVILVFRVALGYKQTRDRYQLLVNKTLYEKTLASGFGSVYFLLDASEQQQYKEALLAYAMLLSRRVSSRASIRDICEQFMYEKFKAKIEMPIDKAMETLLRLGLIIEIPTDGGSSVIAIPMFRGIRDPERPLGQFVGTEDRNKVFQFPFLEGGIDHSRRGGDPVAFRLIDKLSAGLFAS